MQRDDEVYVGHMLDLSRKVASKTAGVRREDFDRDENLRLAVAHLLQTIGEAARRISREYQKAHPEVPWGGIVGMRHKVVHDYMEVDEDVVWKTSVEEIPASSRLLSRSSGADVPTSGPRHETLRKGHHRAPDLNLQLVPRPTAISAQSSARRAC